jgi:hypothetical protein
MGMRGWLARLGPRRLDWRAAWTRVRVSPSRMGERVDRLDVGADGSATRPGLVVDRLASSGDGL